METKNLYLNAHMKELASMMMRTIEYKKAMALKEEEDKKMKAMKSNDNDNNAAVNEKKIKDKGIQKRILTFDTAKTTTKEKQVQKSIQVQMLMQIEMKNSDKNKEEMWYEFFTFPLFGGSVFTLNSVIVQSSFFSLLIFSCPFCKEQETLTILLSTRFF
ncbi:hypothetical protein RFI_32233 [Reticulomyxa filosa]|uniref:Uncharacterized protein n=1 Tax=Reticulomyxa filosa TaxID=46433 RepID=X6LTA0_RETFI|nr:hypothetical protein RFI_32233 [Reticulomyxa filosa]|eukprot:ETO05163.1 hypothetical protein RFI_32233 [Reticulomyxa filosa]